jgi:hypothetical protein
MNGIYPIYINFSYGTANGIVSNPVEVGDLIIGINGEGMPEYPIVKWRDVFFNVAPKNGGKLTITVWRHSTGKIETLEIGRNKSEAAPKRGKKGVDAAVADKDDGKATDAGKDENSGDPADAADDAEEISKAERQKLLAEGGEYYKMMLQRIKEVLADPGKFHPAYDPKQGYEIAGFVWFQGYNDYIASVTYPHGNKPHGYERYSWLLSHLIRNVRKELNVPKMPVVVGVFGQGGDSDKAKGP